MSDDIKNRREIEQSESFHKATKLISGLIPGGDTLVFVTIWKLIG